MTKPRFLWHLLVVATGLIALDVGHESAAQAQNTVLGPIGVQFVQGSPALAPTQVAGVLPQDNFNPVSVANSTGTVGTTVILMDARDNSTGVTLTHVSNDGFYTNTDTSTANGILLHGEDKSGPAGQTVSFNPGLTSTYTFNNVPTGNYDLIAYTEGDMVGVNANLTVGATTYYVTNESVSGGTPSFVAANNTNPTIRVTGNYVEFPNVCPVSGKITLTNTSEGGANDTSAINGFQLVPSIPTIATSRTPTLAPPSAHGTLLVFTSNAWSQSALPSEQNKETIVIAAGWNWNVLGGSAPTDWPLQMAEDAAAENPGANIVTWDWHSDAALPYAGMLAQSEGTGLAQALQLELPNYFGQFHFIGHSLGSLVNRQAIDSLALAGTSGQNITDTILDAPEDIPSTAGLPPGLASTNSNPIPATGNYSAIDNYITSFGEMHSQAENVLLSQGLSQGLIGGHGYTHQWYDSSIQSPGNSSVGFGTTPQAGTYYLQSPDPSSPLTVLSSNSCVIGTIIAARNTTTVRVALLEVDEIHGAIQIVGNVVANSLTDTSNDLFITTPQVVFNGPSSAYAWLPITIPADAQAISFDSLFQNIPAGDSLTVGIGSQILFTLDGAYAQDDTLSNSGAIDVSQWDGQDVDLFCGLFTNGSPSPDGASPAIDPQESVTIQDIAFTSVPEPQTLLPVILSVLSVAGRSRRVRV